ncbi:MAG: hypothetical protein LW701_01990 [Fluviicola sp.]|jgi:hypothetical protein|nr:hypothetical protein [Fluviicola sp.]
MKKTFIIFLLLVGSFYNSFAQYNQGSIMSILNQYHIINPNQTFVRSAKISDIGNNLLISWKISGDTVSGYYVVYKSKNFENIELVGMVPVVSEANSNIPYITSIEDKTPSDHHNFYHIVKFIKNQNINFDYTKIEEISVANISYNKASMNPIVNPYYSQTK